MSWELAVVGIVILTALWHAYRLRRRYDERLAKERRTMKVNNDVRARELTKEEKNMHIMMARLVKIAPQRVGPDRRLAFVVYVAEELLYYGTGPYDVAEVLEYVARQIAHQVEREIRTLNASRLGQMCAVVEPKLDPWRLERLPS